MNNGCVVCTDSGLTYRVPGLALPEESICVAPKTTTLRFLDTAASASTTGTTTASANPTTTTAGDIIIPVTENKTVLFSVCAVASPACTSDVSVTSFTLITSINLELT
jgi:hypothetical protein